MRHIVVSVVNTLKLNICPFLSLCTRKTTNIHAQFKRNSHEAQHQECFAIVAGMDGMLDVSRKTYLQTVEEIYEEATALGDKHGIEIKVHYSTSRGYHLKV